MPVAIETVQRPAHDPAIPDCLAVPAQLFAEMNCSGILERLGRGLLLSRRGGYTGVPLIAFGLAYLAANTRLGLRPFWETHKRSLKRVGAVAGCSSLPSSGSVSRALVRVTMAKADAFADAALSVATMPDLAQVLKHPSVVHRDSKGQPLHVLDVDPSVQAYRMRDLIESDDHPEPERQSPGVAGYTGQYRGEVRIRHVAVCHAGTGAWLAYRMSDDNPRLSVFFRSVVASAVNVMSEAGVPTSQILVRGDGELGSAGIARALTDLGVQLLVRIGRYRLLDRPEVLATLQQATWEETSSWSGRRREAADLGEVMLHPSEKSADAGTPGVRLRVVVARRKVDDTTVSYGTLRDGYQYELFATTLSADAWSAADIVKLYAGRSAIENRYAQQDREIDLERTFSYNAPGQAVFTVLALVLWNYWTYTGFLASPPSDTVPERIPRKAPLAPIEALPASPVAVSIPEPERRAAPEEQPMVTVDPMDPYPRASTEDRSPVVAVLASAYGDLLKVPGWSIDPLAFLRCPNQKRVFPFSIAKVGPGRSKTAQVILRTDVGACDGCPMRAGCFSSTQPNTYKQVARAVTDDEVAVLTSFLSRHRPGRRIRRQAAPHGVAATQPVPCTLKEIVTPPSSPVPGEWECMAPTFEAAKARQRARSQHENVRVDIHISRRRRCSSPPPDPRRTRRTWSQRDDRWRLDANVRLVRHIARQVPKKRGKIMDSSP